MNKLNSASYERPDRLRYQWQIDVAEVQIGPSFIRMRRSTTRNNDNGGTDDAATTTHRETSLKAWFRYTLRPRQMRLCRLAVDTHSLVWVWVQGGDGRERYTATVNHESLNDSKMASSSQDRMRLTGCGAEGSCEPDWRLNDDDMWPQL